MLYATLVIYTLNESYMSSCDIFIFNALSYRVFFIAQSFLVPLPNIIYSRLPENAVAKNVAHLIYAMTILKVVSQSFRLLDAVVKLVEFQFEIRNGKSSPVWTHVRTFYCQFKAGYTSLVKILIWSLNTNFGNQFGGNLSWVKSNETLLAKRKAAISSCIEFYELCLNVLEKWINQCSPCLLLYRIYTIDSIGGDGIKMFRLNIQELWPLKRTFALMLSIALF